MFTLIEEKFYYQMLLIRVFEETIFKLFEKGEISGTTHGYIGQEAIAVGVINHLEDKDIIVSNHRCHGHYLARTGDTEGLMAELMGKSSGLCRGYGGSQHLYRDNFYTNGIQGSMVPVAGGIAMAEKKKKSDAIVVLFIGDGTFGQGVIYEAFNMMSLWNLPVLIVVENNFYAQSTHISLNMSGTLLDRAKAFNISAGHIKSNNIMELYQLFDEIVKSIRYNKQPYMQIIDTYRLCPHSKGDDHRSPEEIEEWKHNDPLKILEKRIERKKQLEIVGEVMEKINKSVMDARNCSLPACIF